MQVEERGGIKWCIPWMVAWARWIPSGSLSTVDAIFSIRDSIAWGVGSGTGRLIGGSWSVGERLDVGGFQTRSGAVT